MNAPYYLLRGGRLFFSWMQGAGSNGYHWSATPDNSSDTYALDFRPGYIRANYIDRCYGVPVRCLAAG